MDRIDRRIRRLRRWKWAMVWVTVVLGVITLGAACIKWMIGMLPNAQLSSPRFLVLVHGGSISFLWDPSGITLPRHQFQFKMFSLEWVPILHTRNFYLIRIPLIYLFVLSCANALYFHRRERIAMRANGICRKCGYDLRGSTGEVCPECGTPKPTSKIGSAQ